MNCATWLIPPWRNKVSFLYPLLTSHWWWASLSGWYNLLDKAKGSCPGRIPLEPLATHMATRGWMHQPGKRYPGGVPIASIMTTWNHMRGCSHYGSHSWLSWPLLVFCFFFLKSFKFLKFLVPQSCATLCNPTDCSLPGSFVHGILQAGILEGVAVPFSRGSSQPRYQSQASCIAVGFFISWATREALMNAEV